MRSRDLLVVLYQDWLTRYPPAYDYVRTDDAVRELQQVPHGRLLYKLYYYGIRVSTHKWIASLPLEHYQNRWASLRSSRGFILCPSRIGLGTGPVLDFH